MENEKQRMESEEIERENDKSASKAFTLIGWVIIFCAIVGGVFAGSVTLFFSTLFSYGPVGVVIIGIGEIIRFLQKIHANSERQ